MSSTKKNQNSVRLLRKFYSNLKVFRFILVFISVHGGARKTQVLGTL